MRDLGSEIARVGLRMIGCRKSSYRPNLWNRYPGTLFLEGSQERGAQCSEGSEAEALGVVPSTTQGACSVG